MSSRPPHDPFAEPNDLRALFERYDRVQRLSDAGCWQTDAGSDRLHWSSNMYRLFGLAAAEFQPTPEAVLGRVHPDDRDAVRNRFARALSTGEDYENDYRVVLPDGRVRVLRERVEAERTPEGAPIRLIGAVQDVTGLRAAEESARGSAQMLAAMLKISPEAIVVTDAQARILAFSAGAEEIFGYRAGEVIGEAIEVLLPARFRAAHRQHVTAFATGADRSLRMHERAVIVGRRRDGEEFPAEASLAKLETPNGEAFTAIVRDLSERRATEARLIEAREEAERANVSKSVFLANMSHEIRTPLNGVLGLTGVLARTSLDPKQRKMVELIETSGRALERLLGDILDLAKLDAGRMSIREEPFDLAGVIVDTAELFRASAAEKNVALRTEFALGDDGRFVGDDLRIRQVLSNLVSNAVKFTSQGEVCISAMRIAETEDAARIRLVVRDTGIGFSADAAEALFERFEQADGSVTRRYGGTGLGLAISRSLVRLMGGAISATSAPGRGATFKVEIPLKRAPRTAESIPGGAVREADRNIRPMRLLLAEDHMVNRMTVELILEHLPVEIVAVEDGRQAVEAFRRDTFDLVLMDMQMPVMDGLTAIRLIREMEAREHRPRTPICVLTANAMTEHHEAAHDAGADAFITKPMNARALVEYVVGVASNEPPAATRTPEPAPD
ncbi:PAS domain S-box protein [Phenylobacterium sp.]|uniref:PAS domain-containing hybrid sensor histidine kinase/response regulator n=1 Tax=Phenylobacterium sp. TaxID=1871053 RepID=UPI0025D29A5C|nr:PAS domain S-box protein [Phenylobacterium sp.]